MDGTLFLILFFSKTSIKNIFSSARGNLWDSSLLRCHCFFRLCVCCFCPQKRLCGVVSFLPPHEIVLRTLSNEELASKGYRGFIDAWIHRSMRCVEEKSCTIAVHEPTENHFSRFREFVFLLWRGRLSWCAYTACFDFHSRIFQNYSVCFSKVFIHSSVEARLLMTQTGLGVIDSPSTFSGILATGQLSSV